ncbi:MAG: glucose 1-dehydrogenase [Mycolicibacterium sp.]|nr:glucose 1-dehydrogenase [Mycolicibacterium sp.]
MRAMTVVPGQKGTAGIEEVPVPDRQEGALLVRGLAVGICGTDREIAEGGYGTPPPGEARLVIGHESLGEVLEAPAGSGFARGDLVVGIVRRPDPVPCPACAAGEWDMCRTDGFGERGIVRRHGYGSEYWRVEPDFAVPILPRLGELGVLLEPASVLAKAWDQVDQISRRAFFMRGRALVTGAGPIGLMACLLGVQRGYEVHVVDLARAGRKRDLVEDLGARYHAGDAADIDVDVDVVIECTGLGMVGRSAGRKLASGGIMCLTGIMNLDPALDLDATTLNRNMVLRNTVLFGSVNAGRRHWEQAAEALAVADPGWLGALITRRVPLTSWTKALDRQPEDIKVVVDLSA